MIQLITLLILIIIGYILYRALTEPTCFDCIYIDIRRECPKAYCCLKKSCKQDYKICDKFEHQTEYEFMEE